MEFFFLLFSIVLFFLGFLKIYQYKKNRTGCVPSEGEIFTYEKQLTSKKQTLYRAVIKFTNHDSKTYYLVSPVAASRFIGALGDRCKILINPKDITKVYLGDNLELIGALILVVFGFILTGVFMHIAKISTINIPSTVFGTICMGAAIWYVSRKPAKAPPEKNGIYEAFKRNNSFLNPWPEVYPEQKEWKSTWVTEEEYVDIIQKNNVLVSWLRPVLALAALSLIYVSGKTFTQTKQYLAVAVHTQGKVVDLESSYSKHGTVYKPIVEFQTSNGETIKFRDITSSSPPSYNVGEFAPVLYDPEDVQNARIDAGYMNYFSTFLFSGFALFIALIAWVVKPMKLDQRLNLKATAFSKTAGK